MTRKLAWRKLLSDPPSAWQRLPLLTRGVGDEILRAVDSDGEIDCGTERPAVVVCRLAAAHPRERRRVAEAIDELLAAGFLAVADRDGSTILSVQLPDLSLAAKGPRPSGKPPHGGPGGGPKRTRSTPEPDANQTRTEREPDANRARTQPEVGPNSAETLNSGSVEEKREEEKRREEIHVTTVGGNSSEGARACAREDMPSDPAVAWIDEPPDEPPDALTRARRALERGYQERYEREASAPWMGGPANWTAIGQVAAWCAAADPEQPERAAERVLGGAFADAWMSTHRWPWKAIARDPARYADARALRARKGRLPPGDGRGFDDPEFTSEFRTEFPDDNDPGFPKVVMSYG